MNAVITTGSLFLSPDSYAPHLIVGSIFLFLGFFFYLKEKNLTEFMEQTGSDEPTGALKKVIFGEAALLLLAFLIGLGILFAVSSRVFGEGLSVFG